MKFLVVTVLMLAGAVVGRCEAAEPAKRPNILLIVSEDNGPELGCYGDPYVRTPHLDRLAQDGVRFDRAYVPQAGCSQSRAAYLTGLYPHQNGQIGLATWRFRMYHEATPNVVRSLKEAGYRTGILGKLHVNPESAFPFDFKSISTSNFSRDRLSRYAKEAGEFFAAGDAPFFLSVNFPDAHRPFLRQVDGLPEHPLEAADVKPLAYFGIDSPALREDMANYYNCLERLDHCIGGLLAALRRAGKEDDTLVVYLGDHGADLFRGKRTSYEGGVRVPLIVRWPGRAEAGQVRDELVSTIDLFPTFLEVAAAEPVKGLPGRSLVPLFEGREVVWRQYLFTEYHLHSNHNFYPQRTVRDDRYKLIQNLMPNTVNPGYDFTIKHFYTANEFVEALVASPPEVQQAYAVSRKPPEFELYDLERDPYEFRNLAEDMQHRAVFDALRKELRDWRERTGDPLLDDRNLTRLHAEIEATRRGDDYTKPDDWDYPTYFFENASVDEPAAR